MAQEITKAKATGGIVKFDPVQTKVRVAGLSAAIKQARKMRDWAATDALIEDLIDLQTAFVGWWRKVVTPGHGSGRGNKKVANLGPFSADDAEAETGIGKRQVSRWAQRIEDREGYKLLLRKSLQAVAMSRDPHVDAADIIAELEGKYSTIVIDPPWPMKKIEYVVKPNQSGFDYMTMDEKQLIEFGQTKLKDLAADDCHLFLWTTQRFLPFSIDLIDQWKFRYVLTMVWHKSGGFQPTALPQYNCEFVVYARRGVPVFLETKNFFCCFEGARREHSRKPDEFYDLIARVTGGPRLDMFARGPHDGFDTWGNQTHLFGVDYAARSQASI